MHLELGARDIFNEICDANGYNEMSYETVARWIRKFKGGLELIEDGPKSGHKTSAVTQKNIIK